MQGARWLKPKVVRQGLIVVAGVALAAGAFGNAVGNMLALRNPRSALRFDPANAAALAGAATLALAGQVTAASKSRDGAALALEALRRGPVAAPGVRAVAIMSSLENDPGRSLRQFKIAETMSRRDPPTQMGLIETCVARNDVGCALTHYDLALTTSTANAAPLFPVLSAALGDPSIVSAIAPYIRRDRPWAAGFVAYAAQQADAATAAALVTTVGRLPSGALNRESESVILGRLGAAGRWDLVQQMYRALEGRAAVSPILGFTAATVDPHRVPVAWQTIGGGSVAASFEPSGRGAVRLRLDVAGDAAGDVEAARRILFLPAGPQAVAIRLKDVDLSTGSMLGLSLRCLAIGDTTGREVAEWRLTTFAQDDHVWRFVVPSACLAQALVLSVRGSRDQADGSIVVDRIALLPGKVEKGRP